MKNVLCTLFAFTFVLGSIAGYPALAEDEAKNAEQKHPATAFVQTLGEEALLSLTDSSLSRDEREKRTRKILRAKFDIDTIGRFALGRYWRAATDKEKKEYLSLFEDMIVKTYAVRFEEYSGQAFEVAGTVNSGEKDSIVSSKILQKDGPSISVEWRVRKKDGKLKVVDVVVENVSMSVTQRADFAAVIQRGGGTIQALLDSLKERTLATKK